MRKHLRWSLLGVLIYSCLVYAGPILPADAPKTGVISRDIQIPDKRSFKLNTQISPCKDFYQYACSEEISQFKMPDDRSKWIYSFNDSYERIRRKKEQAITSSFSHDKKPTAKRQMMINYFQSCVDEKGRAVQETAEIKELKKELEKISDLSKFKQFLQDQYFNGETSFVRADANSDLQNPEMWEMILMPNFLSLGQVEHYKKEDLLKDYEQLVSKFFQMIEIENANEVAKSFIELEKSFAEVHPNRAAMRPRYNDPSLAKARTAIESDYPQVFSKILAKIPTSFVIRDLTPESMKKLTDILERTDLQTLKNVYLFRALAHDIELSRPDFFEEFRNFRVKYLGEAPILPPRVERCTTEVANLFNHELDYELLNEIFPHFNKDQFKAMVEKVRAAIIKGLEKNTWLSEQGKKGAVTKMKTAKMMLVSPDKLKNWNFVTETKYSKNNYEANQKKYSKLAVKKEWDEVLKPRNRERWWMGPLTINAYYSADDNQFVMPQGILQPPFYDQSNTLEQNLGAVGMVIAHELGHGIDDQGSKFNEKGELKAWRTKEDEAEFKKRTERLIDQYTRAGHDGKLTQGENIADTVGMTFSYDAAFPNNVGAAEAKKSFFVQFARAWCGVMREPAYKQALISDPHSLLDVRVNEVLKNINGFHETFSCKQGDSMYLSPEERVKIW